jgi:hypothetical protein
VPVFTVVALGVNSSFCILMWFFVVLCFSETVIGAYIIEICYLSSLKWIRYWILDQSSIENTVVCYLKITDIETCNEIK